MAKSDKERAREYRERRKELGIKRLIITIPEGDVPTFRAAAAAAMARFKASISEAYMLREIEELGHSKKGE